MECHVIIKMYSSLYSVQSEQLLKFVQSVKFSFDPAEDTDSFIKQPFWFH